MSNSQKYQPTESELEILQVLWEKGEATVREVHEALNARREDKVGYTTILKQIQRMYDEKGVLHRKSAGRSHLYRAAIGEDEVQSKLLDRLLDTAFKGSALDMVMHALGNEKVDEQELDALQRWLEEKKGGDQ
jgi:BlaI family penicillinase repressor